MITSPPLRLVLFCMCSDTFLLLQCIKCQQLTITQVKMKIKVVFISAKSVFAVLNLLMPLSKCSFLIVLRSYSGFPICGSLSQPAQPCVRVRSHRPGVCLVEAVGGEIVSVVCPLAWLAEHMSTAYLRNCNGIRNGAPVARGAWCAGQVPSPPLRPLKSVFIESPTERIARP